MHIQITGNNFEIGPHVQELIDKKLKSKLEKVLGSLNSPDLLASLHISRDKAGVHRVLMSLDLPGVGGRMAGQHYNADLVVAVKHVTEEIGRQVEKFKNKAKKI